jgi:hypothetical protein
MTQASRSIKEKAKRRRCGGGERVIGDRDQLRRCQNRAGAGILGSAGGQGAFRGVRLHALGTRASSSQRPVDMAARGLAVELPVDLPVQGD